MTRILCPFRRADGLHELAVLGNFGLAHVYHSSEKVTHFVEDTEVGRDSVHSDSYYIQLDDSFTLAEYKAKGVHLLRNITLDGENATYETFCPGRDRDDQEDWVEYECPASDFRYLLEHEMLIPMKEVRRDEW